MKLKRAILAASLMSSLSTNASIVINIQESPNSTQLIYTITGSHTWTTSQSDKDILDDVTVGYDMYDAGLNIQRDFSFTNSDLMITVNGGAGILIEQIHIDDDGAAANVDDFILRNATAVTISSGDTVVFSGSGTVDTQVSNAFSYVNAGSFNLEENGGGIAVTVTTTPVPEPSSSLLVALGLAGAALRRKR